MNSLRFLQLAAPIAVLPAIACVAAAQGYPARPVTLVVPFAAGGPVDVLARIMAERMKLSLGRPVIIDNVAGAAGSLGVGRVARASPDGYTLSIGPGSSTHVTNAAIYNLPYDVVKDFETAALIATMSEVIVGRKTLPANDLKELIAWLRANPDKASQGTSGVGSSGHIAGVYFQKETGTRFAFVPYRGLAPAMQDLLAGQVDLMIDVPTSALPQVRAGGIKAFAVTAKSRLAAVPDIPTVDEAGLPGFYASVWYALWTPRGTPNAAIGRLNGAVVEALADPVVRARLAEIGQEVVPREQQMPEALRMLQKTEIEKWWPIIKAAHIQGE
jgi:tripartite-type tricarboxylate transporter receptor subunit TctC